MPDPHPTRPDTGILVEEARPEVKQPPLYQVVLLNDDYTPMEFVVDVLEKFFGLDRPTATRIMLEVHTKGKGVCGVFTFEIAETKVAQVTTLCARQSASADVYLGRGMTLLDRHYKCCQTSLNTVSTMPSTRRGKRVTSI